MYSRSRMMLRAHVFMKKGGVYRSTIVLMICMHYMMCAVNTMIGSGIPRNKVNSVAVLENKSASHSAKQHVSHDILYGISPQHITMLRKNADISGANQPIVNFDTALTTELNAVHLLIAAISQDPQLHKIRLYADIITRYKELGVIFSPIFFRRFSTKITPHDMQYWIVHTQSGVNSFWDCYTKYAINAKKTTSKKTINIANVFRAKFIDSWTKTPLSIEDESYIISTYKHEIPDAKITSKIVYMIWNKHYRYAKQLMKFLSPKAHLQVKKFIDSLSLNHVNAAALSYCKINKDRHITSPPQCNLQRLVLSRYILNNKKSETDEIKALEIFSFVKCNEINEKTYWKTAEHMLRLAIRLKKFHTAYSIVNSYISYIRRHPILLRSSQTHRNYVNASWIAGFILTEYLNKHSNAIRHFSDMHHMASMMMSKSQGAYWLAVAHSRSGDKHNAVRVLKIAKSYKGTFYSYIASHILGENITKATLTNANSPKSARQTFSPEIKRAVWLATILYRTGYTQYARIVVDYCVTYGINMHDAASIIKYFMQNKAITLAVRFTKMYCNAGYGLFAIGFPNNKHILPKAYANDPYLYLSLIRQESEFDYTASNVDGGFGLMQLMPRTAQEIAINKGEKYNKHDVLKSVEYGVIYVDSLMAALHSKVTAIAAYNAGKRNALLWVKRNGDPNVIKDIHKVVCWIELIPFVTTRMHVKKVLENLWSYHVLNGKSAKIKLPL